jgi:hypothetical protein
MASNIISMELSNKHFEFIFKFILRQLFTVKMHRTLIKYKKCLYVNSIDQIKVHGTLNEDNC